MFGGTGDDRLSGGGGADRLFGEAGNDLLQGQAGEDVLNGGDGNDILDGGADDDSFFAGSGNDRVLGGNGDDRMDGESGNDILSGGNGIDTLFGSLGSDTLSGGNDNDILVAGVASDALNGDEGDDILIGVDPFVPAFGFGGTPDNPLAPFEQDTLTGGSGRDTFVLGDNGTVLGIEREGSPELYYLGGGNADFALLEDFALGQDTIQLASNILFNDLEFGVSGDSLPSGVTVSFKGDLIAVIQSALFTGANSISSSNFTNINSAAV